MIRPMRVCVFCGANSGTDPVFAATAQALGTALATRGIGLVYGAGSVGLMGIVADAALAAGGEVTGVIPEHLVRMEVGHTSLTTIEVVGTMHERKARMAELADGFIALPGGFGTLDELAEILTWNQLGLIAKPVVLLDVADFFAPLLAWMDDAVSAGFVRAAHRHTAQLSTDVAEAISLATTPSEVTVVGKWLDRA